MQHETDFRDPLAELQRQHAAIVGRITVALLAGTNSGRIRAEALALNRDIAALERRIADAATQREAASQNAISAAAATIADDAMNTLSAALLRLAVPEHP